MKIVITGVGETGYYLAQLLLKDKHDLILVEKNEKAYRYAQEHLDAQIILGDGANVLVLEPLVDETTDLFVALTNQDETNILAALIARRFGVQRAIVRVSDTSNLIHPLLTDDPKVSVLNAEMAVAKDLSRLVGNPSADEIEFFAHGKAEMMKLNVELNSPVSKQMLKNVPLPRSWLVVALIRKGDFFIASGDTLLQPGDHVIVIGDPKTSGQIEQLFGIQKVRVKRVILVGFNEISTSLAQTLHRTGIDVRLIEDDKEKAEQASAQLDDVLVFHGDGTSEEILTQAGIGQTDYLLALTNDDETNILISLLAKERKVGRVIALAHKPQYKPIIEKIGIDSVVNPRWAMVDEIIRCTHLETLSGLNILEGGKGQILEMTVKKQNKIVGVPLAKIKLPDQTLIGALVRNNTVIIPRGEDKICIGDQLLIFTTRSALSEVKQFFAD